VGVWILTGGFVRQCLLENVYCSVAEGKAIAWRSADIVPKLIMYSCAGKIKQRNLIVITSDIFSSVVEKSLTFTRVRSKGNYV